MTYDDVYQLLLVLQYSLGGIEPGAIDLDPDADMFTYDTDYLPDGTVRFRCGIQGLSGNFDKADDHVAVMPIIGLLHEVCGHGGQIKFEFSKDTALSRLLALNCYACTSSDLYYFGRDFNGDKRVFMPQYGRQPFELAAQYMGVKATHGFLSAVYGQERSNELIGSYFRWARDNNVNFVNYDDIQSSVDARVEKLLRAGEVDPKKLNEAAKFDTDDALHAFERKFEACVFLLRAPGFLVGEYTDPKAPVCTEHDKYLHDFSLIGHKGLSHEELDAFKRCKLGPHQDLMMCAARYNHLRDKIGRRLARDSMGAICAVGDLVPKYFEYPVFQNFDWRYTRTFTLVPPDSMLPFCVRPSPQLHLAQTHNMMSDIPREYKVSRPEHLPGWPDDFVAPTGQKLETDHLSAVFAQYQNSKPGDKSSDKSNDTEFSF